MTRFSPNPLNWFKKKKRSDASRVSRQPALLKPPAKPRKSGDIFMHLINIQKSLKSLELSMRQKIDFSWLVQKITGQIAVLKLEAETVKEEELAAVAGQVEAYFETVSEGRLDFDEKGLAVMLEFTHIFKNALGDTVSDQPALHQKRLEGWTESYQALMANMRPTFEETSPPQSLVDTFPAAGTLAEVYEITGEEIEPIDERPEETYEMHPVFELKDDDAEIAPSDYDAEIDTVDEPGIVELDEGAEEISAQADGEEQQFPLEPTAASADLPTEDATPEDEADEVLEEPIPVGSDSSGDFSSPVLEDEVESLDEIGSADMPDEDEPEPEDEIPLYDPSEAVQVRDVVISDAEIKSAREYMELGEEGPEVQETVTADNSPPQLHERMERSPVQLREVERLKSKLSELHEKQEMLSTKMSSILGDYKKAVQTEAVGNDSPSEEELDLEDLEDIIFIGRDKG